MPRRGLVRTTTRPPINTAWPDLTTNGLQGWALIISTATWAARPTSGRLTYSKITRRLLRGAGIPATTSPLTWRMRPSNTCTCSTPRHRKSRSSSIMCPAARIRRTSRPRNGLPGSRESSIWAMKSCASKSLKIRRNSASFRRIPNSLHGRTGRMRMVGRSCPGGISLSFVQKKLYAREAEVFAAYAAYTDYEIGRVIQEVQDEGKLDNTLIIYICGDNGTSAEGTEEGTYNTLTAYNGILKLPEALQMLHYEDWGSDKTYPHMAVQCPGRLTRLSSGPSRWRHISAARDRAWPFPGLATSVMSAVSARSSIT